MKHFNRITFDPNKMGGVACIRNLRIPVATIVSMISEGMSSEEILTEFPELKKADISEALKYAADILRTRELPVA